MVHPAALLVLSPTHPQAMEGLPRPPLFLLAIPHFHLLRLVCLLAHQAVPRQTSLRLQGSTLRHQALALHPDSGVPPVTPRRPDRYALFWCKNRYYHAIAEQKGVTRWAYLLVMLQGWASLVSKRGLKPPTTNARRKWSPRRFRHSDAARLCHKWRVMRSVSQFSHGETQRCIRGKLQTSAEEETKVGNETRQRYWTSKTTCADPRTSAHPNPDITSPFEATNEKKQ